MATITLQDVTKKYPPPTALDRLTPRQTTMGDQADRAFVERVEAREMLERAAQIDRHGEVIALDHVNLTIPDGQTFSVVGPSGCGKSTLLRVVAGLISDYEGRVLYDGRDMREVPPKDRYIGMVFQNYALYPHFKGRGNLSFFFRLHKIDDQETEERIRATAEMMGFGFKELLKRKPGTLSGGQQQRLAIARAIVRGPHLFLFDEPLSNLDAKLRTKTRIEIRRLLHRFRITSIYVTHDQTEALTLGDQIAVMCDGRIEQVGTYQELMSRPANAFVAGFLGMPPMNLLADGEVSGGKLHFAECTVPLPPRVRMMVHTGQRLIMGVRPEAARLVVEGEGTPDGVHLTGTVETVEPDFARRTLLAYVRSGSLFYAAGGTLDALPRVGDVVKVVFPHNQLYFFDAQSGKLIE